MVITFIGRSEWTDVRGAVARRLGAKVVQVDNASEASLPYTPSDDVRAVFLAAPTHGLRQIAEGAVKEMSHLFLDVSQLPPLYDLEPLIHRAHEGGVQLTYSRPYWFAEGLQELLSKGRMNTLWISAGRDAERLDLRRSLNSALDLCCAVCGTSGSRRVDVEIVRGVNRSPLLVLLAIRFNNGSYAQVRLGPATETPEDITILCGNQTGLHHATVGIDRRLIEVETEGFLLAVMEGRPAPVPLRTAVDTIRIVERVFASLR